MMSIFESFYCVGCDISKSSVFMDSTFDKIGVCKSCAKNIHTTKDKTFEGKEFIDIVISPFLYDDVMRDAMRKFKFAGQRLFGEFLTEFALDVLRDTSFFDGCDIIIPVPLHINRLNERGFNQSEIIANTLGRTIGREVVTDALFRVRDTLHQSSLKGLARIENVKGAFTAFPSAVAGKKIILVDDIYTMGETANECAKMLKSAGAEKVVVFALCKTISKSSLFF